MPERDFQQNNDETTAFDWRWSFCRLCGELLIWSCLAFALIYGGRISLRHQIPQGQEYTSTVPLLNLFTVQWNADNFGRETYWHAPIFYPTSGTFAFSEVQPTSILFAPVAWWSPVLAYNLYLLLSLSLTSTLMRRWLRSLNLGPLLSAISGIFVLLLPFLHGELGVLQLTTLWGPVSFAYSLHNFWRKPTWRVAVVCALAFAAMYSACHYYGVMAACVFLLMLPSLVWRRIWQTSCRQFWRRDIVGACVAIVIAASILSPLLWGQWQAMSSNEHRKLSTVRRLSCYADDWLRCGVTANGTISEAMLWVAPSDSRPVGIAFTGMIAAMLGTTFGFASLERRFFVLALLAVVALSFVLSLGPRLSVFGFEPYSWFFQHFPPLKFLRSPFRFAVFGQLASVPLAALGFEGLLKLQRFQIFRGPYWFVGISEEKHEGFCGGHESTGTAVAKTKHKRIRVCGIAGSVLLLSGFFVESWPRSSGICSVDSTYLRPCDWTQWIQNHVEPGKPLLCLPFPFRRNVDAYQPTTEWMLSTRWHQRPLVNGYSGYFPPAFRVAQSRLSTFPSKDSLEFLNTTAITYALVRSDMWQRLPATVQIVPIAYIDEAAGVVILDLSGQ